MNKNYEEEYTLLEIAKYNLKKWPILLICALLCGLLVGAYGYKNTEPSVVYYEELQQVNGAYFVSEYNDTSINERMYDMQQVAGILNTDINLIGLKMASMNYRGFDLRIGIEPKSDFLRS